MTAIDISEVAVARARHGADGAGAKVDWVVGDILRTPLPARSFDLMSIQYPTLPRAAGGESVQAFLEMVRPGGLLLAVYHDLDEEHAEHMKSRGFDPSEYFGADDLSQLVNDGFTVERHAVEARLDPPPDSPHIDDVVLLARKR